MFGRKRSPPHATPASTTPPVTGALHLVKARGIRSNKKSIYTRVSSEVSAIVPQRHDKTEDEARLSRLEGFKAIQHGLAEMEQIVQERERSRLQLSLEKTMNRVTRARLWWSLIRSILFTLVGLAGSAYEFVSHHGEVMTVPRIAVGVGSGLVVVAAYRLATRKSRTVADTLKEAEPPPEAPEDLSRPAELRLQGPNETAWAIRWPRSHADR